jgi:hypothetical protein
MFGLNMSGCAVWNINNYQEARDFYNRCVPTRRGEPAFRKIKGKEGSSAMCVYIENEAVKFQYHRTNVVSWYPDNTYRLDVGYDSRSTAAFANRFVPAGHRVERQGHELHVPGWIYPTKYATPFVTDDGMVSGSERKFVKKLVNRKRAKAALQATSYHDYVHWYKTMWPLVKDNKMKLYQWNEPEVVLMLNDMECWYELMVSGNGCPSEVRYAVYGQANVYDEIREDRLPAGTDTGRWWIE